MMGQGRGQSTLMDNPPAVAVHFVVDGPRSAAAVASGRCRLRGIAIAARRQEPFYSHREDRWGDLLGSLGTLPRLYQDALFGRAVEHVYGLPHDAPFGDLRTLGRLTGAPVKPDSVFIGEGGSAAERAKSSAYGMLGTYDTWVPYIPTKGLEDYYLQAALPIIDPTVAMIVNGLTLDRECLEQIRQSRAAELEACGRQVHDIAGGGLNLNCDEAVRDLLFFKYQLPILSLASDGLPSLSDPSLARLECLHPLIRPLRDYRRAWQVWKAAEDLFRGATAAGQVHAELDPQGGETGHFSCRKPDLDRMPGEVLQAIRARDGHLLLELTVTELEFHVLMHFCQEPGLLHALEGGGVDLDRRCAALALGVQEGSLTPDQFGLGRAIKRAIITGQTGNHLAVELRTTARQAGELLERFYHACPRLAAWIAAVKHEASFRGFVRSFYGMRHHLPADSSDDPEAFYGGQDSFPANWSDNPQAVPGAKRQAVNTIIESTAAEVIKQMVVRLYRGLPGGCRLLLAGRDWILLEVPSDGARQAEVLVEDLLEVPPAGFTVRFRVAMKSGRTWSECRGGSTSAQRPPQETPSARTADSAVAEGAAAGGPRRRRRPSKGRRLAPRRSPSVQGGIQS